MIRGIFKSAITCRILLAILLLPCSASGLGMPKPTKGDYSVPPKVNLDKTSKANKVVKHPGYFSRIPAT